MMKKLNQKGLGLLEVTIAGGIFATLILYVARLSSNMSTMNTKMEVQMDELAFKNHIRKILNNPRSCTRTMGNYCTVKPGQITTPQECENSGGDFKFHQAPLGQILNLAGKSVDPDLSLKPGNSGEVYQNSIPLWSLYSNGSHNAQPLLKMCQLNFFNSGFNSPLLRKIYAGMKITKESFKNLFMNKSYATFDPNALDEHGIERPSVGDLRQLNVNLRDFSYLYFYRHCQEASYSKNITVTRIRVSAVENNGGLEAANYNQSFVEHDGENPNLCDSKCKPNGELVFKGDYNEIVSKCNTSSNVSGTCYSYEKVGNSNNIGELIFHVEYIRRLDPDGVLRTFKEIVQAETVPLVDGEYDGYFENRSASFYPTNSGVYIAKCGMINPTDSYLSYADSVAAVTPGGSTTGNDGGESDGGESDGGDVASAGGDGGTSTTDDSDDDDSDGTTRRTGPIPGATDAADSLDDIDSSVGLGSTRGELLQGPEYTTPEFPSEEVETDLGQDVNGPYYEQGTPVDHLGHGQQPAQGLTEQVEYQGNNGSWDAGNLPTGNAASGANLEGVMNNAQIPGN